MEDDSHFIFVSDFHLAAGKNPLTGKIDRREEFFSDAAFAHFLAFQTQRALQETWRWRLVLLGDIFDFLRTSPSSETSNPQLDTSIEAAHLKLVRIAEGHPVFFQALRQFLERGFAIDILPGNHDIELVRLETQAVLKDLVAGPQSPLRARIVFHPWIYYVPGLLYAEHGQQYHSVNALPRLLAPYASGDPDRLLLPFGSYLETYLFDLSQAVFPGQDLPPSFQILPKAVKEKPGALLTAFPLHARLARQALRSWLTGRRLPNHSREKVFRTHSLPGYADETGLPNELLYAIHSLSSTNPFERLPHLLRRSRPPTQAHYLYQACLKIHHLLESQVKEVPFYVFGHSHAPVKTQLHPSTREAYYLNCGSWTGKSTYVSPFVEIHHSTKHSPKAASLLSWDDQAGHIEPYPDSSD